MKTSLVKGLSKNDTEIVTRQFDESISLRRQLVKVLQEKSKSNEGEVLSKELYENPNWAYRQADSVGYRRALEEIISLLSDKVVEKSQN